MARRGAELIRLRAAENGRWVVSAASSGVSQIVDPHGYVQASLPPMAEGVLTGRAGRVRGLTVYTRAGWLVPWAAVVLAAGMAGMALGRGRVRTGEGSPTAG